MQIGGSFRTAWLAEIIRLREAHAGPLHDATEVRRVIVDGGNFENRIVRRAEYLSRRENLDSLLDRWVAIARWSLAILLLLAVLAGIGTAAGTLGDGSRSINLVLAIAATLGLHVLTFLLWLMGLAWHTRSRGAGLGRLWLGLTQRLARGPDAALAPRALAGLLGRSGALTWALGTISHLLWLTALLSMLLSLLGLLATRRYSFNWETTVLAPDTFVSLTQTLGRVPEALGFNMPSESLIRLSDGLHTLPAEANALWSSWLIGCVVVYGILPRLLALCVCALLTRRGIARASILDITLPGFAGLRARLMPVSEKLAPDGPAQPNPTAAAARQHGAIKHGAPAIVGIELDPQASWPPTGLPPSVQDLGSVDTREQRHHVLDQLHLAGVSRLLVVCDALQTPDRGVLNYISELASYADETRVAFYTADDPANLDNSESRLGVWRNELKTTGFAPEQLYLEPAAAKHWLQGRADESTRSS